MTTLPPPPSGPPVIMHKVAENIGYLLGYVYATYMAPIVASASHQFEIALSRHIATAMVALLATVIVYVASAAAGRVFKAYWNWVMAIVFFAVAYAQIQGLYYDRQ